MATICGSCFTTDTGFKVEADYPYSVTYENPERLYCIDGVPTAPPARAAVAPLSLSYSADPVSSPADGSYFSAPTATSIAWTNLSARSCSVFCYIDGYLIGGTSVEGDYVSLVATLTASDAQTAQAIASIAVPYSAGATISSTSFTATSDTLILAPGVSVTVTVLASFDTPSTTTAVINALKCTGIFMGSAQ